MLTLVSSPTLMPMGNVSTAPPPQLVFTREPNELYYVIKGRPVTVTCAASSAAQIFIKCAGKWIQPAKHINSEILDPVTHARCLQTSVEVIKEEMEEQIGSDGFWCECHAISSHPGLSPQQKTFKSRRGQIIVACKSLNTCIF